MLRKKLFAAFILVCGLAVLAAQSSVHALSTEVRSGAGTLKGVAESGVVSFKGIPFAKPPVGPLRWHPPQAHEPWQGVRDASAYGAACPQPARGDGLGGGQAKVQDEDCLTLNVWAPEGAKGLPVMVWIHGGAHRIGSGSFPIYDGTELAKQGVVLVTINYRLGLLGYFAHPALTAEAGPNAPLGNYGFMDQLAALKWVQRNIASFGGDPGRVTMFGESAGGASGLYILASPEAKGLLHGAIIQSGGGLQRPQSLAEQELRGATLMTAAGAPANATASDLRALSSDKVLQAAGPLQGMGAGSGFNPFIDGRLIKEAPYKAFQDGRALDVPLIIGANSYEASVMEMLGVGGEMIAAIAGDKANEMRALYGGPAISDEDYRRQALGDIAFVAPARWVAEAAAPGKPSYLYHFSYVAKFRRGQVPGARHGSEIPYIFQTWSKLPVPPAMISEEETAMARLISACWVAFAKTGKPACEGAPSWPAYAAGGDELLEFGTQTSVRKNFRKAQIDFLIARFFAALAPR